MKSPMNARWFLLFLGLIAGALAAESGIEFIGVLGSGANTQVALRNGPTGASHWVAVGREFAGYAVVRYDAKTETVTLAKAGQEIRLTLQQGKTQAGAAAEPPPEIKRGILNYLRQLCAAADQFYLENGKSTTTYEQLVGTDKYVKAVVPLAGENYRAIQFVQGQTMTVTTASGYSMSYAP
jgi:hypothetical protein